MKYKRTAFEILNIMIVYKSVRYDMNYESIMDEMFVDVLQIHNGTLNLQ